MEHINLEKTAMGAVGDAVDELTQIASLCYAMMFLDSRPGGADLDAEMIVGIMRHLWNALDTQIKALDAIQWTQRKAAGA